MPRAFEAVHCGAGEALDEVDEVTVGKDRVAGSPQHERGGLVATEVRDARADAAELCEALVRLIDGDVGDESADPTTAGRGAVRRAVSGAHCGVEARVGQGEGCVEECARVHGRMRQDAAREGESQGRRNRGASRLVNRGVESHNPRKDVRVVDGPAEGDDSAPVMAQRDHGQVGFSAECI